MSIAERLATLAPKSLWPVKDVPGGGTPEMTIADLAQAAAHASPAGYAIVIAKYVDPTSNQLLHEAWRQAYLQVIDMARERKWSPGPRGERYLGRITVMAVLEVTHPMRCPECRGACRHACNGQICASCRGTGKMTLSRTARAFLLGIPETSYRREWGDRYEQVFRMLSGMESEALHVAARQFFDKTVED